MNGAFLGYSGNGIKVLGVNSMSRLAFSQVLIYDFSCILLQGRILMIAQKCYLFALSLDEL
jgi:hypothetical protein